jgi:hypothetical protein
MANTTDSSGKIFVLLLLSVDVTLITTGHDLGLSTSTIIKLFRGTFLEGYRQLLDH